MCASRSLAWIQFQNERDDARTAFCTDTTREESAQNERSRARDRAFSLFVCHDRKKKLQRRAIRLESLRQFNTRREEKEMRVRGLKNAERRKAHNDAADDDEKEEEEKKGEKESRKARREKIPP